MDMIVAAEPNLDTVWDQAPQTNRIVFGTGVRRAGSRYDRSRPASPDVVRYNTPDPARVSAIALLLEATALAWSAGDTVPLTPGEAAYVGTALRRVRALRDALSCNDYLLGWGHGRVLVERAGQRCPGQRRSGEISAVIDRPSLDGHVLHWNGLNADDRLGAALLLLFVGKGKGTTLEEINRMADIGRVPFVLGRLFSIVEENLGRPVFDLAAPADVQVAEYEALKQTMLDACGLVETVFVEGRRKVVFLPAEYAEPDAVTLRGLADALGVPAGLWGMPDAPGRKRAVAGAVLARHGLDAAVGQVLLHQWQHLGEQGMVYTRRSRAEPAAGDAFVSWGVFFGNAYRYDARIEQEGDRLVVQAAEQPLTRIPLRRPLVEQPWRMTDADFAAMPERMRRAVGDTAQAVQARIRAGEPLTEAEQLAIDKVAAIFFHRLVCHNSNRLLAGTQLGATGLQPGWHTGHASDGSVDNPAHAERLVESFFRKPFWSHLGSYRVWGGKRDSAALYGVVDIPRAMAYDRALTLLLEAAWELEPDGP